MKGYVLAGGLSLGSYWIAIWAFTLAPLAMVAALRETSVLFAMLIVGVMLGGFETWLNQGKWRRMGRARTHEALRWKGEAERLLRERDAGVTEKKKQLALANR